MFIVPRLIAPSAPEREGFITTVAPGQVRVQLDDPLVEVRLSTDDLRRSADENMVLESEGAELRCAAADGVRSLFVGNKVKIKASFPDGEKLHYTLVD